MSEESESCTDGPFKLSELQGLACVFWADHCVLQHASASLEGGQFAALPEELRQWCLSHLPAGNITVAPVTLDGQAVQQFLEDLLTCLGSMVPREEIPRQVPPRTSLPHSDVNHRNARRGERKKTEVTIFTFGRFTICRNAREIALPPRHGDMLCKLLLCQSGRRASYSWLIDQLWPLSDADQAIQYLYAAATAFRTAVSPDLLLTQRQTQSYELASQDQLWVDADAALSLIAEAETLGRGTKESLPLLEQAVQYFRRGRFLAGVEETWVQARRLHLETMKERAWLALAEVYGQQGKMQQAETLLTEALCEDSTNENLLRALMQTLHEEGMTHQALRAYEEFARAQRRMALEPAEATTALYEQLRRAPQVFDLSPGKRPAPPLLPLVFSCEKLSEDASPSGSSEVADPSRASNDGEGSAILMRSRGIEAGIVPAGENAVDELFTPGMSFGLMIWDIRPK